MKMPTCAMAFAVFLATGSVFAQAPPTSSQASGVDASRLPVDTARIQRALRQSPVWASSPNDFWNYYVEVQAHAPEFRLFGDTPTPMTSPAPYGAPTHSEMFMLLAPSSLRASTSMAFRRPAPARKSSR